MHFTGVLDTWILLETALLSRERDGHSGVRCDAEDRACVRVESARKIQRHQRCGRGVHGGDRVRVAAGDRPVEARPKEAVDDERCVGEVISDRFGVFGRNHCGLDAELAEERPIGLRIAA